MMMIRHLRKHGEESTPSSELLVGILQKAVALLFVIDHLLLLLDVKIFCLVFSVTTTEKKCAIISKVDTAKQKKVLL